MDKSALISQIITQLNEALAHAIKAAEEAHKGATHDQSKAETQYDTLGLEHAYLAEGQGRRITELKDQISQLQHFKLNTFHEDDPIYLGSFVTLEAVGHSREPLHVFLAPCAGGLSVQWSEKTIQVISSNSPMTQALLGLYLGDDFKLASGQTYTITQVD